MIKTAKFLSVATFVVGCFIVTVSQPAIADKLPLAQRLVSSDPAVRDQATREFDRLPPEAKEQFIPDLTVALNDDDPDIRLQASTLLKEVGMSNRAGSPDFKQVVRDDKAQDVTTLSHEDQYQALQKAKLQDFPDMKQAVDDEKKQIPAGDLSTVTPGESGSGAIIEALRDPDPWVRAHAARRLSLLNNPPMDAIPLLIGMLKDKDPELRASAASALGGYGPAAQEAIPTLLRTLADPDPGVRQITAESLKMIKNPNTD